MCFLESRLPECNFCDQSLKHVYMLEAMLVTVKSPDYNRLLQLLPAYAIQLIKQMIFCLARR